MGKLRNQAGFTGLEGILIVLVVAVIGFGGYYVWHTQKTKSSTATTSAKTITSKQTSKPTTTPVNPYAGWLSYVSNTEKAMFKYPNTWKTSPPKISSNFPEADGVTITSPSGTITVNWLSAISGLGGACDNTVAPKDGGCPSLAVISSTPVVNASGLYVIEATLTSDGNTYQPWIGLNTSDLKSGQIMPYATFWGRNNASLANAGGQKQLVFFNTNGIYIGGPKLNTADAQAWFNNGEAQQAKLILASFSY